MIVLDLRDARRGFPSQLEDDAAAQPRVLPPPPEGAYPHAEERRLCYVAMTRARRGAYLIADSLRPSTFVEELLRELPGPAPLRRFQTRPHAPVPALPHGPP